MGSLLEEGFDAETAVAFIGSFQVPLAVIGPEAAVQEQHLSQAVMLLLLVDILDKDLQL